MVTDLGFLGGSLLGIGGNLLSGAISSGNDKESQKRQYLYQRLLNEQQYELQQQGLREQYTNARQGLETAGYNPILAATNGVSGMSVGNGSVSAPSTHLDDMGDNITNALQTRSNIKLQDAQTGATNAQEELVNQQALTEQSKRTNLQFDNAMKDALKHKYDKETSWIDREKNAKIYKDMQDAELARASASVRAYEAETGRITANAHQLNSQTTATWTPYKIGSGVASGILGYGLGKLKSLKSINKFTKTH